MKDNDELANDQAKQINQEDADTDTPIMYAGLPVFLPENEIKNENDQNHKGVSESVAIDSDMHNLTQHMVEIIIQPPASDEEEAIDPSEIVLTTDEVMPPELIFREEEMKESEDTMLIKEEEGNIQVELYSETGEINLDVDDVTEQIPEMIIKQEEIDTYLDSEEVVKDSEDMSITLIQRMDVEPNENILGI
ncbi:uncharacterized protein LOC114358495 isoform X2 [Ostrinia furnacalis]|nr:uncharacterized protein LOC114358495 isoform X2 [Ostrinia furnacalis]